MVHTRLVDKLANVLLALYQRHLKKRAFFSLPPTVAAHTPSTKHVDGSGTDMWL